MTTSGDATTAPTQISCLVSAVSSRRVIVLAVFLRLLGCHRFFGAIFLRFPPRIVRTPLPRQNASSCGGDEYGPDRNPKRQNEADVWIQTPRTVTDKSAGKLSCPILQLLRRSWSHRQTHPPVETNIGIAVLRTLFDHAWVQRLCSRCFLIPLAVSS